MKILFVKTSSLGDLVHHAPAVSDAARKIPGAEIHWVVEEAFVPIAALHASVHRVIPVALRRWRKHWWQGATWAEIRDLRAELAAERYDAIIDTQSLVKSAFVARLALGPRHGMDAASARERLAARFYAFRHSVPRALHAVERNRRLTAAALGYAPDLALEYGFTPIERSSEEAPYAVLLTMTSRADKLWQEERWVEAGRALGARAVLPWGNDAERARVLRIAQRLPRAEVAPRLTLDQMARLLARAQCVLGVDTGLTHLAAALGTRTVGIYCGSDPALTGIYGAPRARNVGRRGEPPEAAQVIQALQ